MISLFGSKVGQEELEEIRLSIEKQWLGIGPKCAALEKGLAAHLKAEHFVLVNSGSNALMAAVKLLDLPAGSEVIVPSFTWVSCAHAVILNGLKVKFCDVDLVTQNVRPEDIEPHITKNTSAIMIIHYAGKPVNVEEIKNFKLPIIEDAAHAIDSKIGRRYCGTLGDIGIYSFDAVKNITMGEGGGITTASSEVADKARLLRYCGIGKSGFEASANKKRWWEYNIAYFFPKIIPNDISAAIGLHQLKKLIKLQYARKKVWDYYSSELSKLGWLNIPINAAKGEQHSYFTYCIRLKNDKRDELANYLYSKEIYTSLRYHPLHMNKIYGAESISLKNTEELNETALNIPLHANLSDSDVEKVVTEIKNFGIKHC